jgi:GT2 family glycosyltransferase/predicted Zn-dependent protease
MARRYLFGPVTADFAEQYLSSARRAGECLAFSGDGSTDLSIGAGDTWEAVCSRFPPGWQPDFLALYLPYTIIPACLWAAPIPLLGLAADWNLLWHYYRRRLPCCDLVLTDLPGVEVLAGEGIPHARAANLFGLPRSFLDAAPTAAERDIDILFVGNLHLAVQRERLPWLARLAGLRERWRVVVQTRTFGDAYRALLGRARVVFNRSLCGECNRRAFEAAAAGALLFQEAENREVPTYLQSGRHFIAYTADTLEPLLEHYLEHEDERRALAEAARVQAQTCGFEDFWQEQLHLLEGDWERLQARVGQRPALEPEADLLARTWQALGSSPSGDPVLEYDLANALVARPGSAALHNALGLTVARKADGPGPQAVAERAAGHFRRALERDPAHLLAGLNLAEALAQAGQPHAAREQARQTLDRLDPAGGAAPAGLDAGPFPPGFDLFRVAWERAAWAHAGDPAAEAAAKVTLLRGRLHGLLAGLTGDLAHAYEAVLARPDLPEPRAALGGLLARAGRAAEAVPHLAQAARANPFDADTARALFQALGQAGDDAGQRRLARDRRRLAAAAPQVVPREGWFADAAPVGDELASIIVLCCNELEATRLCLESVLRQTRPPYELVLVDNGSTDGTPAYLDALRSRPGPVRVEVLRNDSNRGFPAGCNQALARARGRYVVFLNNDTVVPAGWLDGLVAWATHYWPHVGLVGAVSNYAPPPQLVAADYAALDGLAAFAARRAQEYARRAVRVERLSGFCLLARRAVLEQVGGFDERFGLGFFDDVLCVRAREAGFHLLVALDVFVHHFGSRTFAGLGLDCRRQLQENFARFQAKWGPERAAGYRAPGGGEAVAHQPDAPARDAGEPSLARRAGEEGGAVSHQPDAPARDAATPSLARRAGMQPPLHTGAPAGLESCPTARAPAAPAGRPRVSLCLIVKDEEANLPACLGAAADLVDEIVVVDTGSSDRTGEVAASFGARVYDFPWPDSFAAARNESLRHATGDWVFWLDADDRLDEDNRGRLRALFAGLDGDAAAYAMQCRCLPDPVTGATTVVDHVRLFRNHPEIRWRYRVHEQILPAVRATGGTARWADVVIDHTGYQDPALRRRKLARDLRLLQLEDAEHPDDPFTLFNLGSVYLELGRIEEALPLLGRSLQRSQPSDSIVRKLYALLAQGHRRLGRPAEAVAACQGGRRHYPDDAELLFQEALGRQELRDPAGAEACLLRLLEGREGKHFASLDAGLRGHKARHKARHNLAVLYQGQGRRAEAEAQWRVAAAEAPGFAPAWLGLGELYLHEGRWGELEEAAARLEAEAAAAAEAAALRARGHLARWKFAAARACLGEAIAREPAALRPRIILSHVLLQEGRDWAAAEQALRDVLGRDPGQDEARRNLAVLLRQQGRDAETAQHPAAFP